MSYPEAHTSIYPVYCYENFKKSIFSISCNTQMLLTVSAFITCIPVSICLKRQCYQTTRNYSKIVIFCLFLSLQLLVFIHYFFILPEGIFIVITAQQLISCAAQILICYRYCKRTSRLINNPKSIIIAL